MRRHCEYCNRDSIWELCLVRTWFTLFFIPIIPYKKRYCVCCSNCDSYFELEREKFEELKATLETGNQQGAEVKEEIPDSVKYAGKTETQIEYIKHMESLNNKE